MLATTLATLLLTQAAPTGEVPFKIGDDAIIVDAVVNGRKASFMFDTGFSGALVVNDAINIGKPTGTMMLRDFVGEFAAGTVPIKTLKMGALSLDTSEWEAVQQPMSHMSASYNVHTDGIMGLSIMRGHVLEINFQKSKFIFHPPSYDITKRVPDNKKTFMAKMLPTGMFAIEMTVEAENGKKMTLALDTGNAFFATTHKDVLERVGLWAPGAKPSFMRTAWVASGPTDSFYLRIPKVKIYGVDVENSVWSIIDLPSSSSSHDGTIGFGFLKNFNLILDLDRRRVWMENYTNEVSNKSMADVGISAGFDPRKNRVRVFGVTPDSPAQKAGVRPGDDLLGIEGHEVLNMGPRELSKLFEGEPDTSVRFTLSRDGVLKEYELKRQYLFNEAQLQK